MYFLLSYCLLSSWRVSGFQKELFQSIFKANAVYDLKTNCFQEILVLHLGLINDGSHLLIRMPNLIESGVSVDS